MAISEAMLRLRRDGLSWTSAADEIIALDLRASVYLSTNESGKAIWQLLEEGTTQSALVQMLVDSYEIPTETAAADVSAYLLQLRSRDLLAGDG